MDSEKPLGGVMGFKMQCPKCGSLNYSIERDGRSYFSTGPSSELVFSCRCGKQLFGEALEKEFNRQLAAFEAQAESRVAEEREREEREREEAERRESMRKAIEYRQKYLAEKRKEEEEAERARKEEADRRWRERVTAQGDDEDLDDDLSDEASDEDAPEDEAAAAGDEASDDDDGENPPGTPPGKAEHLCGWGPCTNEARDNSKYCSRVCSNKNARWRHKQRKTTPKRGKKSKAQEAA